MCGLRVSRLESGGFQPRNAGLRNVVARYVHVAARCSRPSGSSRPDGLGAPFAAFWGLVRLTLWLT